MTRTKTVSTSNPARSLRTAATHLARLAAGTALSLGLAMTVFGTPVQAQTQAQVAGHEAPQTSAQATDQTRPAADPALWVVRDADSTVYLFGTVHLLKPGTAWHSPRVDAAFDSASEVWFEVSNPDDQAALAPIIQQYGLSPDRPLSSVLTSEDMAALDTAARSMGATAAQLDPMRPWFAAMMIGMTPLTQAGYEAQAGVDLDLRARALAADKPIKGFETLDQQISGLAQMSDAGQLTYLRHYLRTQDTAAATYDQAVAGWRVGDEAAIAAYARANGRDISEETHQIFMASRNADWADQIQTLMQGSGTVFIAVGAAHLGGEDNLLEILKSRGLEVSRD